MWVYVRNRSGTGMQVHTLHDGPFRTVSPCHDTPITHAFSLRAPNEQMRGYRPIPPPQVTGAVLSTRVQPRCNTMMCT